LFGLGEGGDQIRRGHCLITLGEGKKAFLEPTEEGKRRKEKERRKRGGKLAEQQKP